MKKLKVMTIVGTRPEIIRLSRIMTLLDQNTDHIIVHTGQNYDYELNGIFWEELELRKPNLFLNVNTASLGTTIGDIIAKSEVVLKNERPDALLVLGDTNSCLAAYMAKRMHIPIFHMEAGNRCFDQNVPEETNRKIIDHIADFNLVYTEHARRHLLSEGIPHRRIYLTGSPMKEVLDYYKAKIDNSPVFDILKKHIVIKPKQFFLASIHREENVDNHINLRRITDVFETLVSNYKLPIIVSTHPRTKKQLERLNINLNSNKLIHFLKPFGFLDYNHLQQNATCVISDSGTISEESSILGFPAISLRQSMERPEAQDTGSIILTGFDNDTILESIMITIKDFQLNKHIHNIPNDYLINNTSWRVLKLIVGNSKLNSIWSGLVKKD